MAAMIISLNFHGFEGIVGVDDIVEMLTIDYFRFWSSAPHLESNTPVFLKSALHINCANLALAGDDGLVPQSSSGRVHSLDSNYTTDVLR